MSRYTKHLVQQVHLISWELYKQLEETDQEDLALDLVRAAQDLYNLHFNNTDHALQEIQKP